MRGSPYYHQFWTQQHAPADGLKIWWKTHFPYFWKTLLYFQMLRNVWSVTIIWASRSIIDTVHKLRSLTRSTNYLGYLRSAVMALSFPKKKLFFYWKHLLQNSGFGPYIVDNISHLPVFVNIFLHLHFALYLSCKKKKKSWNSFFPKFMIIMIIIFLESINIKFVINKSGSRRDWFGKKKHNSRDLSF